MAHKLRPHVASQSIYYFDIDDKTLTFCDYDLFAPGRDLSLHMGFVVKRISADVTEVKRCELRRAKADLASLEAAFKKSTKVGADEARIELVDGAVNFKVTDRLDVAADEALLLALEYSIGLESQGPKLLFSGAIQPSDYRNIQNSLRVFDVRKEVVLQAVSRNAFSVRIFNASQPVAFPRSIEAQASHHSPPVFSVRESFSLDLQDWERALYFTMCQD